MSDVLASNAPNPSMGVIVTNEPLELLRGRASRTAAGTSEFRMLAWIVMAIGVGGSWASILHAANPPIVRREITAVESSAEELKNLRHAVFMLKKQPPTCADTTATSEYDCWAAYHNNFDLYGCIHGSDLFWPWHRYHLAAFEKALRNSDPQHPERVRSVTLPYWDWTAAPSGTNFPASLEKEFIDPSELYPEDCSEATCKNPLWVPGRRSSTSCDRVRTECVREAVALNSWSDFGGGERGPIGDFELQAHNYMHALYIGGRMGNPVTAAQDPIYWFFHAYIDKVWDQWQAAHQADPCAATNVPDPKRSLSAGAAWPPPGVAFENVLCAKALGYAYEELRGPVILLLPSCPRREASCATEAPPVPVAVDLDVPAAGNDMQLALSGVTAPSEFSYVIKVFLHPKAVAFDAANPEVRRKYFAKELVVWRHHGHAHDASDAHTVDLRVDVSDSMRDLRDAGAGKDIRATILLSVANAQERSTPIVFGRDVTFAKASLVVPTPPASREFPATIMKP